MQNPRAPVACGVTVATFWLCPGLKMLLTRLHMETLALWKGPRSTSGFGEYGRLLGACPATHTSSHRPGGMGGPTRSGGCFLAWLPRARYSGLR